MENISNEEKQAYQKKMLNVLMIDFLRSTNIEFSIVNHPKFRAMFELIRPDIVLPTTSDLIKVNVDKYDTFKRWELMNPDEYENLEKQRHEMVRQWMQTDILECRESNNEYMPNSLSNCFQLSQTSVGRERRSDEQSVFPNEMEEESSMDNEFDANSENSNDMAQSSPNVNSQDIKLEPISDYDDAPIETKPSLEDLQMQENSNAGNSTSESQIMNNPVTSDSFGTGPSTSLTNCKSEFELLLKKYKITRVEEEKSLIGSIDNGKSSQKRSKSSIQLTTFEHIPGYVKWPCLVCNQQMEMTKVRSVNNTDAYIMIYVCVMNDKYDMDKAKELARMQRFKCCVSHLDELYESALHFLGVVDPDIDIHTDNEKIVQAYHAVKGIKDSRFVQKLVFEGSRKHIVPFCNTLKNFFQKYARKNYIRQATRKILPTEIYGFGEIPIETK
ncbi:Lin-15A/B-like domain-containing protein [Caenorhabditis elegans]|uniref:Lin-15A/B-like domain-containing protein n=1 Tax=Caenorhabditis elegans TaxID=6239 RepID=Q22771_CAEEL|nr:Uncharacterized protein CELE_T25B9.8 [Caenorhabditis elegans]CAA94379.3 Uncharacterized protein CELE_T25B9.8 [Caenorhabditis elegans]|eukprot:NP_501997.2 Uncharacterized protein CELE_T25B9.8 [Caenorhabditis elegans]